MFPGRRILPTLRDVLNAGDKSRIVRTTHTEKMNSYEPGKEIHEDQSLSSLSTIRGSFEIGAQYHYTMEAQTTLCIPAEDGGLDVYTATQWMDLAQIAVAEALKIPQNSVNIVVRRLGGAYGAKISRGTQIACACALACHLTRRPIRFVMTIEANMMVCGKRFACKNDYTISAETLTGRIKALTNSYIQDAGCSLNELLLPITTGAIYNCYGPNSTWLIQSSALRTDAPSHTWCRAPNHTEGIAMIESIMEHIAREVAKDPSDVRLVNIQNDNPMKKIYADYLGDVGKRVIIDSV